MFNHNTYFAEARETVFRNNLFLRASSIGSKFTSNTGSGTNAINAWDLLIDNNLYIEGEVGISLGGNDDQNNGPRWRNVHVTNNVMMHIGRTQPTQRTLGWGLDVQDWDGGLVSGNVFTAWGDSTSTTTRHPRGRRQQRRATPATSFTTSPAVSWSSSSTARPETHFTGNDIGPAYAGQDVLHARQQCRLREQLIYSARNAAQWFSVNDAYASLAQYQSAAGDTTSVAGQRSYADPARTIETYLASKGYATDMDSFAALLCSQSKFNWIPDLKASAINDYIRAGFAH
jgi:hypothetical protein